MKKSIYTIERIINEDGTASLSRTCDGFNALELLGLLEEIQLDILRQMSGEFKPNIVERTLIKDKKE